MIYLAKPEVYSRPVSEVSSSHNFTNEAKSCLGGLKSESKSSVQSFIEAPTPQDRLHSASQLAVTEEEKTTFTKAQLIRFDFEYDKECRARKEEKRRQKFIKKVQIR